jgi:hypothetical protein
VAAFRLANPLRGVPLIERVDTLEERVTELAAQKPRCSSLLTRFMGISWATRDSRQMRRRARSSLNAVPWPERWPLLAPATGAVLATVGAGVAINEEDWGATTIFGLLGATLVLVALRNLRSLSDRGMAHLDD